MTGPDRARNPQIQVLHGDCRELLRGLEENSIDACVTDPPYELSFMSRNWDGTGIAFDATFWQEVYRVLKPGAHLLAFGAPRTYHRMAVAIEDAGFEIRDSVHWCTGSGFPKGMDVSKAIDRMAGAEREIVGATTHPDGRPRNVVARDAGIHAGGQRKNGVGLPVTAPATDAARQWAGWNVALKPAHEPIVVARKPISESSVAANCLRWGTGALNIDAGRIAGIPPSVPQPMFNSPTGQVYGFKTGEGRNGIMSHSTGRWPANLILTHSIACGPVCDDSCPVAEMDRQSGQSESRVGMRGILQRHDVASPETANPKAGTNSVRGHTDTGGASRFFQHCNYDDADIPAFLYVAKAARSERERGLDSATATNVNDGRTTPIDNPYQRGETQRLNTHPTVKPVSLMKYLISLVTPPGGIVLDCFVGSGTAGVAAVELGVNFIGIEKEAEYVDLARSRVADAEQRMRLPLLDVMEPEPTPQPEQIALELT